MRGTLLATLMLGGLLQMSVGFAFSQSSLPPALPSTVVVNNSPPRATTPPDGFTTPPLVLGTPSVSQVFSGPPMSEKEAEDARIKSLVDRLVDERLKAINAAPKTPAGESKKDPEFTVGKGLTGATASWRNGFWFETPAKDFSMHIGGAVQYDMGLYSTQQSLVTGPRSIGAVEDGVNLRRGRLRAEGKVWEVVDYRFELEFFNAYTPPGAAGGINRQSEQQTFMTTGPTDAWITITHLPIVGNVRVGNQKEPIGLDHLESFRFLPFMERSPLFDYNTATAFNNGFSPGIMLFDTAFDERATWAIGGFKNSYNVGGFSVGDGEYVVTGRLTGLPLYEDEGRKLVHVGIAGSHRDSVFSQDRFRVRPSIRSSAGPATSFIPVLLDTGFFGTNSQDILALEFFANYGSFTLQAEYMGTWNSDSILAGTNIGTTFFQGYYVQALYWLTGEHTRWDKKSAAPDRYVVNRPFFLVNGEHGLCKSPGAWQVGVRFSNVDTNSRGVTGGMLNDLTFGLNWILNPNIKFQWNYDYAHRYGVGPAGTGDFNGVGMRCQFDF